MKYQYTYEFPIGFITIVASHEEVFAISYDQQFQFLVKEIPLIKEVYQQLREYFEHKRTTFSLPLHLDGTVFQKKVWRALQEIPYGKTVSYQEIAMMIGNIKAVRAVGHANNQNKIVIVIPCHRVIGKNGKLVGYGGGIDKKIYLLNHEDNFLEE